MWYELSCVENATGKCFVSDHDELWIAESTIEEMNAEFPGEFSEWCIVVRGKK
jgi:hypothetical protein